jgi:starch phosphorylase
MQLLAKIPTQALPAVSSLPERLSGLVRLAYNFYWSWHPSVQELFAQINPTAWARGQGPVSILRDVRDFSALASNKDFLAKYDAALKSFDGYFSNTSSHWYATKGDSSQTLAKAPVAYFCAEFGLHESFNIYSGGLGILAGDHCKEASDLGLPFVGIGLFYRRGFFKQMVDAEGRQEHFFPTLDPSVLPLKRIEKDGKPLSVVVELDGRNVTVAAWLAEVGRAPLILLDTDLPENAPEDRPITSQLYTSGRDMRLHQELVLGVGGVRVLRALGIEPGVWHMNEGHSAFLLVERLREHMNAGVSFDDAVSKIKKCSVFTIHTPVPAGNERFWGEHCLKVLAPMLKGSKVPVESVMLLGQGVDKDPHYFDMTAFGLRLANGKNGVSLLHGHTADDTWRKATHSEIIGVTNGVHMPTWLGAKMKELFAKAGGDFSEMSRMDVTATGQAGRGRWEKVVALLAKDVWDAHVDQKKYLIEFARIRMAEQHKRHGKGPGEIRTTLAALDPNAFTIGFARRFATYKRASLIFSDEKRLAKLLQNKDRPVQIVFAGKAHPADRAGQKLISRIYQQTQSPRFAGKVFYIEEYDMEVGRALVQGVDMWLNNPRRPLEASGTSGMKAAANGVPNMSILDGWWDEAADVRKGFENGFVIGDRHMATREDVQDRNDAADLYRVLESQVLPAFFERNAEGTPEAWVKIMLNSIASCAYDFSTMRMLEDYTSKLYLPAAKG